MKLKVDPRTNRLEFSTDINSVFDIAWLTLARMLSEDPAPEDKGKSDNRPEAVSYTHLSLLSVIEFPVVSIDCIHAGI